MTDAAPLDGEGWIDISIPLDEHTPIFEGDPTFRLERAFSIDGGAMANVSRLEMGVHTGTHLDAPIHFIDGAPHSQSIPLVAGIGPAWVADATGHLGHRISAAELAELEIPADATRVLLKTRNSALWDQPGFQSTFVGLDGDAAEALVARGTRLIGVDYLSVAPFGDPVDTHQALLAAGVVILEGIDLGEVEPGPVDLLCLPIRLMNSDGVPARALVRPR